VKNLYLARHAKSDWSIEGISDIDRPLNQRGYSDAHRVGAHLKSRLDGPILFISSPAVRAITTSLIIAREINYDPATIRIDKELYEAAMEVYWKMLPALDDKFDSVFIFGHNPTTSDVLIKLTGARINELPTCAVVQIQIKTDSWSEILKSKNEVLMQLFPSTLRE
jgi:phosphohistidine phosphatase